MIMKVFSGAAINPRLFKGEYYPELNDIKTGKKKKILFFQYDEKKQVRTGRWIVELSRGCGNSEENFTEFFKTEEEAKARLKEIYEN